MPGRGQYWKKGGLIDESVKEEDLSQALQTKVNAVGGGSGNWEKVGDVTVSGGPVTSQNVDLSRTVDIDGTDCSMLVAVITTKLSSSSSVTYRYNNITTGGYSTSGNDLGGATYTSFNEGGNEIHTDKGYTGSVFSILELAGQNDGGNVKGNIREAGSGESVGAIGHFTINTTVTAITSFQLIALAGAVIQDGSRIVLYAVTLN